MAAHFSATWGLFVPAAVINGLAAATLWTAKSQYLNMVTEIYIYGYRMGQTLYQLQYNYHYTVLAVVDISDVFCGNWLE